MKVYTKEHVKELMLKHYPVCADRQYSQWYCNCGVYINYRDQYGDHLDVVFNRTKGDN